MSPGFRVHRAALAEGVHFVSGVAPSDFEGPPVVWVSADGASAGHAALAGLYQAYAGRGCVRAPDGTRWICVR